MKQILTSLAGIGATLLLAAAPAAAHVEPTVQEVPAGSYATVDFTVQHGCDGSPTVKLEFQIPEELDDLVAVEKAGWTSSSTDEVVTFDGGPLPPDEETDFSVQFTVPPLQGSTLTFPFIQTCEEGSIDWIQLGSDAERPAPTVTIGAPDPDAPAPPTTTTPSETSETSTTGVATTQAAVPLGSPTPDGTEEADDADAVDSGASPWLAVGGVVMVTAIVIGTVIFLRTREK
jgi:uncharacterized protein YcnI